MATDRSDVELQAKSEQDNAVFVLRVPTTFGDTAIAIQWALDYFLERLCIRNAAVRCRQFVGGAYCDQWVGSHRFSVSTNQRLAEMMARELADAFASIHPKRQSPTSSESAS